MSGSDNIRRIVIDRKIKLAQWGHLVRWAANNNYNTLVIPLEYLLRLTKKKTARLLKIADSEKMAVEAGGWELSRFIPRHLYFFRRELFRMDFGRRKLKFNFCPTNPKTIEYLKKGVFRLLGKIAARFDSGRILPVFHLWPDRSKENVWCSCPACRAFTPAEQNLIAVNSAADALAEICPQAKVSWLDLSENAAQNPPAAGIQPRHNAFAVKPAPLCLSETVYKPGR